MLIAVKLSTGVNIQTPSGIKVGKRQLTIQHQKLSPYAAPGHVVDFDNEYGMLLSKSTYLLVKILTRISETTA